MEKILIFGYFNVGVAYFFLFLNFIFGNLMLPIIISYLFLMFAFVLSWLARDRKVIEYKIFTFLAAFYAVYVIFFLF